MIETSPRLHPPPAESDTPAPSITLEPTATPLTTLHPDEQSARVQPAACYRIFAWLGWTEMIYNHMTVHLPDSVTGGDGSS